MNELKSYTEYAVSTPTADFVIGFDFNYGEDAVNVTVDDVPATEAGYTVVYLNETTIRLSPSVPSGVVRLQRETDIDQTDHAYRAGAKFIAQTMDENFEQLRHSQQEVRDGFVKLAGDTYEIIDTLNDVGQSAQDAADAAEVAAALANNAAAQVNDKVSYEDFNNKPHNAMLGRDAASAHPTSSILDASGETQQQVNYNGGSKWHSRVGGYKENEYAVLTNGNIVKSTIDGNLNDPNSDMTGWFLIGSDKITTVESFADLAGLEKWHGRVVKTKGYYAATNFDLAQPYVGGATYIYNAETNKWDYISTDGVVDVCQFGADPNRVLDSTQAFKNAVQYCCLNRIKDLDAQSGIYIVSDTIYMTEVDESGNPLRRDQGVTIRGAGRYNTYILFKANYENQVLFDTYAVSAIDNNRCIYGVSIRPFTNAEDINNPFDIVDSAYLHMGIGINAREVCGSFYEDIDIKGLYAGIQWTCGNGDPISYTGNDISDASRGWCEFNRFNNINLWINKIGVLIYGGGSYHGNSFKNTKIQGMEEWMWQRIGQSTGTCYGIKAIAGINTNRLPDPYWQLCNIYNVNLEINFFGNISPNYKFIAISVDKARTFAQTGGFMSHEGNIYFEAKNDGWWTFDGDINGYNLKFLTDDSQNNQSPYGNFSFRNWSSNLIGSGMQSNQTPINQISTSDIYRLVEEPDNNLKNTFARAINSSACPDVLRVSGDNVESLAFTVYDFDGYNNFWFGVNGFKSKPKDFKPTFSYNAYGTVRKTYSDGDSFENKIYSSDGVTLKAGYKINSQAFQAHQTNTLSLGLSSNVWKDVFTQNAVTVVSDVRYKTEISALNEQELQCAIACSKLYRKYKLNSAVDEKGLNSARYHLGVIAQEVVQCFTDHGLDWRKYGIITYEKWDAIEAVEYQAATYDENDQELTPEIQAIEGCEAGEIYMVRYDELNCFINAGIEYRLSRLE